MVNRKQEINDCRVWLFTIREIRFTSSIVREKYCFVYFRVFAIYHIRNTIYENGDGGNCPEVLCLFLNLGGAGRRPLRGDISPFNIIRNQGKERSSV